MKQNNEHVIIFEREPESCILNELTDDEVNFLREKKYIDNGKINFVGKLSLGDKNIFSYPFIFKEYKFDNLDFDIEQKVLDSIDLANSKATKLDDSSLGILRVNKQEQVKLEFQSYFAINSYPTYTKSEYSTNLGKLDFKKTCKSNNFLIIDGKLIYKNIYYRKKKPYEHIVHDLIDAFLFLECDYTTKNADIKYKDFFHKKESLHILKSLMPKSNNHHHKKYLKLMISYIESYFDEYSGTFMCRNYNFVWQSIVEEWLINNDWSGKGEYKYKITTENSDKETSIQFDHFHEGNKIILDSKYKNIKRERNHLDFKQLFYQLFKQSKTDNCGYTNGLIFPVLSQTEDKPLVKECYYEFDTVPSLHLYILGLNYIVALSSYVEAK